MFRYIILYFILYAAMVGAAFCVGVIFINMITPSDTPHSVLAGACAALLTYRPLEIQGVTTGSGPVIPGC
jgi:hypothetical protein